MVKMANLNFRIVEGDDFFESVKDEFTQLYNDGVKIQDIQDRLGLSKSQYMNYFQKLRRSGDITKVRNPRAGKKADLRDHYKKHPKHYSFNKRSGFWTVRFCEQYYTSFRKKEQAVRFVELMRECDWDMSCKDELRQKVLKWSEKA